MTDLDEKALAELLAEISERLRWSHEDLQTLIAAGSGRDVIQKAQEDFETIGAQHRLLLVALEQMRRSPSRRQGNGRACDADASPAT